MRLGKLTPAQQLCVNRRLSIERLKKGQQMEIGDMDDHSPRIEEIPGELNTEQEADMAAADLRLCNARNGIKHELENSARKSWDSLTESSQNEWAKRCMNGESYASVAEMFKVAWAE